MRTKIIVLILLPIVVAVHTKYLAVERGYFAIGGEWLLYALSLYAVVSSILKQFVREENAKCSE